MDLAAKRSARRWEKLVMRLGCVLVSLALLVSLVVQPPRAKAFALTTGTVAALSGAFLAACGLAPVVSGMSSSGEVSESLARLLQDFLDEEHPGVKDAVDWIGAAALTVTGTGQLVIPRSMGEKLGQFAAWVASKFGTNAGINEVYNEKALYFADGTQIIMGTRGSGSSSSSISIPADATPFSIGTGYELSSGFLLGILYFDGSFYMTPIPGGGQNGSRISDVTNGQIFYLARAVGSTDLYVTPVVSTSSGFRSLGYSWTPSLLMPVSVGLSLDVAESITIPEGLTDTQSIALDVGATQTMEIQDILQGILDSILVGDLTATAEVVDTAELPEEPGEPVVPLPPEGLDELGAALTSRFPFSIPWDVYRAVQLLAAPAEAPYFEVDFLAPIAHRVGGWKGSTKIVLDFAEYEIIGQVSRWASTIGFCLMLASGTKRLIWTA